MISFLRSVFVLSLGLGLVTMATVTFYFYLANQHPSQHVISLDYPDDYSTIKDTDLTYSPFPSDKILNITTQLLPHPRSHVVTNSSHVITLFACARGCAQEKKYGIVYQYLKIVLVCQHLDTPGYFCKTWSWDPANWTLEFSDVLEPPIVYNGYLICAYPIKTDRVHRIVHVNGTIELPGCSPKRNSCTTIDPYFDTQLRMRINWSPCCRALNIKLLSDTTDLFEAQGVRYVLIGGACISVARENGSFIPYDTDLDMMIFIKDREKLRNVTAHALRKLGYYLTWHRHGSYVRFCVNSFCDAHIDAWFYEFLPNNRNRVRYHGMNWWEVREGMIFPTSRRYFEGKLYRFPRKLESYLDHEYSTGVMAGYKNWRDVFLCNYKMGRKCTHYAEAVKKKKRKKYE
ncbi:uncharacterized protein LOC116601392 [Nematostella vectensis]|uniref:uncharacterized protein LOC116601392 n=1 Tax=Nematostella vectensis TaxID=45351 RepID=UPI00138FA755|nr:uncharacterized protein LOC116601392 [Nematostella vectensis]